MFQSVRVPLFSPTLPSSTVIREHAITAVKPPISPCLLTAADRAHDLFKVVKVVNRLKEGPVGARFGDYLVLCCANLPCVI